MESLLQDRLARLLLLVSSSQIPVDRAGVSLLDTLEKLDPTSEDDAPKQIARTAALAKENASIDKELGTLSLSRLLSYLPQYFSRVRDPY